MKQRLSTLFLLLAAAVPGLLFAPVFGLGSLLVPVFAVLLAVYVAVELGLRVPATLPWRPLIALVLGLLAVTWTELGATTAAGLPTGATLRALLDGVTQSWQLTLQSTWPARPDAQLILFVPLAVLVAAVLGVELLRWALAALLPSVVLLGLSQAYFALTGREALLAGLGFAVLAAGLLAVSRQRPPEQRATRRIGAVALVVPTVVLAVAGAFAITWADPVKPAVSLQQNHSVPLPPGRYTNPLDQIAERLLKPDVEVFSYTTKDPVDRWRMVVLDQFDGGTWSPQLNPKKMGSTVAQTRSVTVPTEEHSASVDYPDPEGPWLPSQPLPVSVTGAGPLIDQDTGVLLLEQRPADRVDYRLTWRDPQTTAKDLNSRGIDADAPLNGVGAVQPEISALAKKAVGNKRPTVQTALVLARYLSKNYRVATGDDLPTGAGLPQLHDFLVTSHRGTSEQFAAAYVVLARVIGIPARLAVGYRAGTPGPNGTMVVHNADVFAWPEIAVDGIGWVPLNLTEQAAGAGAKSTGLAGEADKAKNALPPQSELEDPKLPPTPPAADAPRDGAPITVPWPAIVVVVVVLGLLALLVVPALKLVRGWRRRRLRGARGVVAAWTEARDLLRAHGVAVTSGMTVRELAQAAQPLGEPSIGAALHRLAELVDAVLWSGGDAPPDAVPAAWASVKQVRKGLAGRGARHRVRAALHLDSLRPLGLPTIVGSRASAGRLPA